MARHKDSRGAARQFYKSCGFIRVQSVSRIRTHKRLSLRESTRTYSHHLAELRSSSGLLRVFGEETSARFRLLELKVPLQVLFDQGPVDSVPEGESSARSRSAWDARVGRSEHPSHGIETDLASITTMSAAGVVLIAFANTGTLHNLLQNALDNAVTI